jgi:hypothetical protein
MEKKAPAEQGNNGWLAAQAYADCIIWNVTPTRLAHTLAAGLDGDVEKKTERKVGYSTLQDSYL